MEVAPVVPLLPRNFVIHTHVGTTEGYALYSWIEGGITQTDHRPIHSIHSAGHRDLYYNILDDTLTTGQWHAIASKKGRGRVVRPMTWRLTTKSLNYTGPTEIRRFPVIEISNTSTTLPPSKTSTFIPIIAPGIAPIVAPVVAPVVPVGPKIYTIAVIPQHAVRAMLRDAAMYEEACPITGNDIDIENGAITSCFHLFEKNAIATWLALPNSHDKCPVCNNKCNMFML